MPHAAAAQKLLASGLQLVEGTWVHLLRVHVGCVLGDTPHRLVALQHGRQRLLQLLGYSHLQPHNIHSHDGKAPDHWQGAGAGPKRAGGSEWVQCRASAIHKDTVVAAEAAFRTAVAEAAPLLAGRVVALLMFATPPGSCPSVAPALVPDPSATAGAVQAADVADTGPATGNVAGGGGSQVDRPTFRLTGGDPSSSGVG